MSIVRHSPPDGVRQACEGCSKGQSSPCRACQSHDRGVALVGYRIVAALLGMNKNTVQHIFPLKGWQVRKQAIGFRPRIQTLPSIARFGTLGRVSEPFLLRSDNGLVFTSRSYTALVCSYGLRQEFITPHCPPQNGMVERAIRALKEQCLHRHRVETLRHASRVIGDSIRFYNHRRPHQALNMKTPAETHALAT